MIDLKKINQQLQKDLDQKTNPMALPRLEKVVVNYRVPEARESQEALVKAEQELSVITGQKAQLCRAKKAVSTFKIRAGDPLALKVTLRGKRMYHFIERLFNLVLPRLRDFRGLPVEAFDAQGNYNLVIDDQTYFAEVDLDKANKIRPIQITIRTISSSKKEAKMLLSTLGFPFSKQ